MSIIRENNKNRGRVFRCFAIYNADRQEFTHVQRRKCGKSYEATIQSVRELAEKQSASGGATLTYQNSYSEWYGQVDEKKKCYYLFMLYPKANLQVVQSSLNQLIRLITSIPNYWLLTIEQLDQLKRSDIRKLIDKLENEYMEQENLGVGQPSDDEQAGSRIIMQSSRTNPQSSFRSQHLQQSKIETTENMKTLDKEYLEFGVYRGFIVYNPKDQKQLFSLRRGSKQTFSQSLTLIKQHVETLQNKGPFVKFFNTKSEWHVAIDIAEDQQSYYFMLMTFQNADKDSCNQLLDDLIKKFKRHHYQKLSAEELNQTLLWDVSHQLKSAEKHYEYDNGGALGSPSDNEQSPKLCEVKQSAFGTTKNYSSFSATKQELIHLEIIPRSQLQLIGEKEIESPIQNIQTILEKLNHFEPQINDTENLLQYSVMGSLIILLIIFIFLFHQ